MPVIQHNLGHWSNLTSEMITNLYLYGETTTPADYEERLRSSTEYQNTISIRLDMQAMMESGPGRYATAPQAQFVQDFFENGVVQHPNGSGPLLGSYTKSALVGLGFNEKLFEFSHKQMFLDINSNDYIERTYIYNSQRFTLSDNTMFHFNGSGNTNYISNLEVRIFDENFDFTSSEGVRGWVANLGNTIFLENVMDSHSIGRTVDIEYRGTGSTFSGNYTLSNYDIEKAAFESIDAPPEISAMAYPGTAGYIIVGGVLLDGMLSLVNSMRNAGVFNDAHYGTNFADHITFENDTDEIPAVVTGEGNDTIEFDYFDPTGTLVFSGVGDDTIFSKGNNDIDGGEGIDTASYINVLHVGGVIASLVTGKTTINSHVDTLINIENLVGSNQDDVITGNSVNNLLQGEGGIDILYGGNGNDTLEGGLLGDKLDGGEDDDTLNGQEGDDLLFGRSGFDTYVFAISGDGDDTITDDSGLLKIGNHYVIATGVEDTVNPGNYQLTNSDGWTFDAVKENNDQDLRLSWGGANETVLLKNFSDGDYGISLGENLPPELLPDTFWVDPLTNTPLNVLLNDIDPDGTIDPTSLRIVGGTNVGAVIVSGGQLTYSSPNADSTTAIIYEVADDDGATAQMGAVIHTGAGDENHPLHPNYVPPSSGGGGGGGSGNGGDEAIFYDPTDDTPWWEKLWDKVVELWNDLMDWLDETWTDFTDWLSDIWDWITDLFSNLWEAIWKDPLAVDLDADGIELLDIDASNVYFDIDADGFSENIGWIAPDDGLLVYDFNNNGTIDDISELFGNQFATGFEELALMDSNSNDIFDSGDANWSEVKIWQDLDSDGIADAGEVNTLDSHGITQISLAYEFLGEQSQGNIIADTGTFVINGQEQLAVDLLFATDNFDAIPNPNLSGTIPSVDAQALIPQSRGYGEVQPMDVAATENPALYTMLRDFAELELTDLSQSRAMAEEIMVEWLGVSNIDPNSRGTYIDAQMIDGIEVFFGREFSNNAIGGTGQILSLPGNTRDLLYRVWEGMVENIHDRLILQGPLKDFFPEMQYVEEVGAVFIGKDADLILGNVYNYAAEHYGEAGVTDVVVTVVRLVDKYRVVLDINSTELDGKLNDLLEQHLGTAIDFAQADTYIMGTENAEEISWKNVISWQGTGTNDLIYGGAGDDTLTGDAGNDTIIGGAGNDILKGHDMYNIYLSGGTDLFVHSIGDGDDTIYAASNSLSTVIINGASDEELLFNVSDFGNDLIVTNKTTGEVQTLVNQYYAINLGFDFSTVNDIDVTGGLTMYGDDVAESLNGTQWADSILGAAGDDFIKANSGDDTIIAGTGNDTVYGQGGWNSFIHNVGDGNDQYQDEYGALSNVIVNGVASNDIYLNVSGDNLIVTDVANQEVITLYNHFYGTSTMGYRFGTLNGENITAGLTIKGTSATAGESLYGTAHADTLIGGLGDDVLYGEGGHNMFVHNVGDGNDILVEDYNALSDVVMNGVASDDIYLTVNINNLIATNIASGEQLILNQHYYGTDTQGFRFGTLNGVNIAGGIVARGTSATAGETIYASTYADTIIGGLGDDVLYGQGGTDHYIHAIGDGNDTLIGEQSEMSTIEIQGIDNDDLRFNVNGLNLIISNVVNSETLTLQSHYYQTQYGYKFVSVNGIDITGALPIIGSENGEVLNGTAGNDNIWGGAGNDTLYGGAGDDTLIGGTGNDLAYGQGGVNHFVHNVGDGNDVLNDDYNAMSVINMNGVANNDLYFSVSTSNVNLLLVKDIATGEQLTLSQHYYGTATYGYRFATLNGIDLTSGLTIKGTSATAGETIYATGFGDTVIGGLGNDILYGRGGGDTYIHNVGDGSDTLVDNYNALATIQMNGVAAEDIYFAKASSSNNDLIVTNIANGEKLTLSSHFYGTEANGYRFGSVNGIDLTGGLTIKGTSATAGESLHGTIHADTIIGGLGNDVIYTQGQDTIVHAIGDGNDLLIGNYGDLAVIEMQGVAAEDIDFFVNGNSLQIIDTVNNEVLTLSNHYYNAEVLGYRFGSVNGIDITGGLSVQAGSDADNIGGSPLSDSIRGGAANDTLIGYNGDDTLYGEADNDVLNGHYDNDFLYGGDGNDNLSGSNGNDLLQGDAGNDTLHGGHNNDTLIGGAGNDSLDGYGGNDIFVFGANSGVDTINGFNNVDDMLQFEDGLFATAADAVAAFNNGALDLGNGNMVVFLYGTGFTEADVIIV